jgi:molybdenum cofactor cytidylyltransferase
MEMGIAANQVACIVLAAGRSKRFGTADKLAAELFGRPLLHHVLETLNAFDFAQKIVVCQPTTLDVAGFGFDRADVDSAEGLQSDSLRTGIRALRTAPLAGILFALGDMPAVSHDHIHRLLEQFDAHDERCVVASDLEGARVPPALFAIGLVDDMVGMTGDRGARSLLRKAVSVRASRAELVDVDTPDDLERASKR